MSYSLLYNMQTKCKHVKHLLVQVWLFAHVTLVFAQYTCYVKNKIFGMFNELTVYMKYFQQLFFKRIIILNICFTCLQSVELFLTYTYVNKIPTFDIFLFFCAYESNCPMQCYVSLLSH